jgi:hypothetical protein
MFVREKTATSKYFNTREVSTSSNPGIYPIITRRGMSTRKSAHTTRGSISRIMMSSDPN